MLFNTKISHKWRLTSPPNLQFCLSSSKERTVHLSSSDKITMVIQSCVCFKEFNHMNTSGKQCFPPTASHRDMQNFKDKNMIIKQHKWNKLARKTYIKEGSSSQYLTVTVSLKHKCLGNFSINNQHKSQLLNFISWHTITNTQFESEGLSRLVMRLGYKQFMVFLGCKSLSSRRAFILRSILFLFIPASVTCLFHLRHLASNKSPHNFYFWNFFFSLFFFIFFILAAFIYCF